MASLLTQTLCPLSLTECLKMILRHHHSDQVTEVPRMDTPSATCVAGRHTGDHDQGDILLSTPVSRTRPGQATDLLDLLEQYTIRHELDPGFFCHVPLITDLVGDNPIGRRLIISELVMSLEQWAAGALVTWSL